MPYHARGSDRAVAVQTTWRKTVPSFGWMSKQGTALDFPLTDDDFRGPDFHVPGCFPASSSVTLRTRIRRQRVSRAQ